MSYLFQYKEYAESLYQALKEDAFYITMEKTAGEVDISKQAMLRYMDYSMAEAKSYGELYIPPDQEYGASVWSKPLNETLELKKSKDKKEFIANYMGSECLKLYKSIVEFMEEKAIPLIGKEYWYLSIVGVLPEFQGRGLGIGLISNVLSKTDAMGIPTYLETFTKRNIKFYNRLGYSAVESFFEPTTRSEYWLLVREPRLVYGE